VKYQQPADSMDVDTRCLSLGGKKTVELRHSWGRDDMTITDVESGPQQQRQTQIPPITPAPIGRRMTTMAEWDQMRVRSSPKFLSADTSLSPEGRGRPHAVHLFWTRGHAFEKHCILEILSINQSCENSLGTDWWPNPLLTILYVRATCQSPDAGPGVVGIRSVEACLWTQNGSGSRSKFIAVWSLRPTTYKMFNRLLLRAIMTTTDSNYMDKQFLPTTSGLLFSIFKCSVCKEVYFGRLGHSLASQNMGSAGVVRHSAVKNSKIWRPGITLNFGEVA